MNESVSAFSSEIANLSTKVKQKAPVTFREVALVIANHESTFLSFLLDNDPAQVYKLLNFSNAPLVVGKGAAFIPDKKRAGGELHLLLIKKDWETLNQVISNFVINMDAKNYTTNSSILKELQDLKVIIPTEKGYMFNVKLS